MRRLPQPAVAPTSQAKAGVPKFWTDEEMKNLKLPLADAAVSPRHVSADYSYQVLEIQLHRSAIPFTNPTESRRVT